MEVVTLEKIKQANKLCLSLVVLNILIGLAAGFIIGNKALQVLTLELYIFVPAILYILKNRETFTSNITDYIWWILFVFTLAAGGFWVTFALSLSQVMILISQGYIFVTVLCYIIITKQNLWKLIWVKKISFVTVLLIIIFTYSILPLLSMVNAISMLFSTNVIQNTVSQVVGNSLSIGLILVALIPAFVEEVTYRGAVYHGMRGARPMKGIIISALLFGAMHMNFNQFFYAALIGIIMGLLVEATGSILSSMVMHFVFNANSVVLLFLMPKLEKLLSSISGETMEPFSSNFTIGRDQLVLSIISMIPLAVIGTIVAVGIFVLIAHVNNRWKYLNTWIDKKVNKALPKYKIVDKYLIASWVLCLIIAVITEVGNRM